MQGKHVLVTGGTGGLGLGVTPEVLRRGAYVTLPYRSRANAERLKSLVSPSELVRLQWVEADLLDEGRVAELVQGMERVDGLIHLMGGFSMGPTPSYSLEQWRQDLDLNLTATFLVCKHVLARMLEQNYGRIVTIASRGAVQPAGQLAAYAASKAGVVAFTKAIAAETKGTNVTANVVLPSVIDTPANRKAMGTENAGEWVKPESLAHTICELASEAAGDIRGAALPIYGNL
ncbi:3-oxoacyl-ACP reductase FabG [Synechococcus sp. PCC 7336]|uniref:3-oxoacyl-ACP reductase FabG n=1 Tax=Synechococcus sp. PCC 7336 TaxID=195250 RepID=UPI00034C3912|nr:3-oxoacyl-ACP reductase FabG [Synechococcus sp. PCC 7336]